MMDIYYVVNQFKGTSAGLEILEETKAFLTVESAIEHHSKLEKENEFKIHTRFEISVVYDD